MNTTSNTTTTPTNTSMTASSFGAFPQEQALAPEQTIKASSNPFETQIKSNPFHVNCKAFVPTAEITPFKMVINSTFTPSTTSSSGYTSEESEKVCQHTQGSEQVDDGKYKTEMCKNWIETNQCRYGSKCQFAHGKEELAVFKRSTQRRTKNCRVFYKEKQCMYGSRCMFRHEHRHFDQIMRHYYAVQLYTMESLYETAKDQAEYVNTMKSDVRKLPVFSGIHAQFEEEEEDSTNSECEFIDDDSSLSFIEMEEDIIAFCDPEIKSPTECEAESVLNISHSTFGSSQEGPVSTEVAHKHETDCEVASKTNTTAQLNQLIDGAHDLSF